MANIRNSNTFYVDTQYSVATDELAIKNLKVSYIILTASSTTNALTLSDSGGVVKITVKTATANETKVIDVRKFPMVFPTGIRPTTVTACVATIIFDETRA